ncbi:MAG TPA: inositol monophosphatase, partial [Clostridia bacterium]|nr:inositol monophosphatase [Clostridia bacterium]
PLDGTSNFVAGIPWFGVMIGVLRDSKPVLGAMYLPIEKTLYFAEAGQGAYRNRDRVQVTSETDLQNLLCAFGFDPTPDLSSRKNVEMLFRVSGAFRNVRTTNSLVDFCYTTDGRFGGCINLKTKIWDIAAASIILPEAGGKLTYVDGRELAFELDEQIIQKEFAVLGASIELHPKLVALARAKGK